MAKTARHKNRKNWASVIKKWLPNSFEFDIKFDATPLKSGVKIGRQYLRSCRWEKGLFPKLLDGEKCQKPKKTNGEVNDGS